MSKPDFSGASIVNLSESIRRGMGAAQGRYPALSMLPPESFSNARCIVQVVVDGMGYSFFKKYAAHLQNYLKGSLTSVFPTSTAPAVTSFMMGTAPAQHGVTGWFMYLEELKETVAMLPFRERKTGVSLVPRGQPVKSLVGGVSMADELPVASTVIIKQEIKDSPYNVAVSGRAERKSYREGRNAICDFVASILSEVKEKPSERRWVYAYWPLLDSLSHCFGPQSPEVIQHFASLDTNLSRLIQELKGTNSLVLITADHGFIGLDSSCVIRLENYPAISECLAKPLCGEPRSPFVYIKPGFDKQFEQTFQKELSSYFELYHAQDLISGGWFGIEPIYKKLQARLGDYILMPRNNYVLKDRIGSEGVFKDLGAHGGSHEDEMYVPLICLEC